MSMQTDERARRQGAAPAALHGDGTAGRRVLVVDDDPMLRMLASEVLRGDFVVQEAVSGGDALAIFAASRPDLVLLDVMMPGLDGFDVCRALRATAAGAATPILMMTGRDDAASIDRAYEVGATDFVTKPLSYALLPHRVRYLLRAAGAFSEARQNAARLARAQRLAGIAQWELDVARGRFRWSDEAADVYGIPIEEADVPTALLRWVHAEDRDEVRRVLMWTGSHRIDYRMVLPDGRTRFVHQEAEVVVDPVEGRAILEGAAQDITELRDAERQVHDLAYFDSLTRLRTAPSCSAS